MSTGTADVLVVGGGVIGVATAHACARRGLSVTLVEGVPVTRAALAEEAAVTLGAPPQAALAEVDEVAQQLGVSSLR